MIHLPNEIWLHIFKHMECIYMFEMRKVCFYFRNLVDHHVASYYHFHRKSLPFIYIKNEDDKIVKDDLMKAAMIEFIYKKNEITRYCFEIQNPHLCSLSLKQLQQVYTLIRRNDFTIFSAKSCGDYTKDQINSIVALKESGLPDCYAIDFGKRDSMTMDKIPLVKKLLDLEVSTYYAGKIATEFNDEETQQFLHWRETTNLWFVHIAHMVRPH